jgi:hypothetical protein
MLAVEINDHVAQALARFLEQYKQKPNLAGLMTAFVEQIQDLENATFDLNEGRQLFNGTSFPAVGTQLDGIGQIVGIARNGLDDMEYLVFILGKIAENFSDTTITTIVNIIKMLYNAPDLYVKEIFPAGVAYELGSPLLDPSLFDIAKFLVENSLGAAIAIVYIATYDASSAFRFTSVGGPQIGKGFGDTLDPTAGGGFAGLIFNNVNA